MSEGNLTASQEKQAAAQGVCASKIRKEAGKEA
jgi:hypothetical protein